MPQITILLATYNGARYIEAQLASLAAQTHTDWRLLVSDDGSTDATLSIVRAFASRVSQPVEISQGPGRGASANFMRMAADPQVGGDYFAFCDQDDVWYPRKLERALEWLRPIGVSRPAVYGARTRLVDADGRPTGFSHRFQRAPSFGNALAQSIAGGNTMLLNRGAKQLFEAAGPLDVVSHDWWLYQLVAGAGGVILYDPEPCLDYRQHGQNAIGGNRTLRARLKRSRMAIAGGFRAWNDTNMAALQKSRHLLTREARSKLDAYERMRSSKLADRIGAFAGSGIRRQSVLGDIGLFCAAVLGKV